MALNKYLNIVVRQKGTAQAEQGMKSLGTSIAGMAGKLGLATVGFGTLAIGLKKSITAFGEQEKAEKKLASALGYTSRALLEQAAALQQVSIFGDEAIIQGQALLAYFVKDEESIKKATQATLDLASAKGMDLVSAFDLVSKTLGSSTNALSRYGIEVDGAVGSSERLTSLVDNLNKAFGGAAEAETDTMSGRITQMTNALGDMFEVLGGLIAPVVTYTAKELKIFFQDIQAGVEWIDKLVSSNKDWEGSAHVMPDLNKKITSGVEEQNEAVEEIIPTYEEWKKKTEEQIKLQGILADYQKQLNEELKSESGEPIVPDATGMLSVYAEIEQEIEKITETEKEAVDMTDIWTSRLKLARMQSQMMGQALIMQWDQGKSAAQSYFEMLFDYIKRLAAEMLSRAILYGLFSMIPGGSFILGGLNFGQWVTGNMNYRAGNPLGRVATATPGQTSGNVIVNIDGNVVQNTEWVRDILIPEINDAIFKGYA